MKGVDYGDKYLDYYEYNWGLICVIVLLLIWVNKKMGIIIFMIMDWGNNGMYLLLWTCI